MSMEATAKLNSECAVIGSICIDAASFKVAERMLTAADFGQMRAAKAFAAATELRASGKPIDPVAIAESLGEGGVNYIAECMQATPTAANIELYCEGVLNGSKRRKMSELADKLGDSSYDLTADPDAVFEYVRSEIDGVKSTSSEIISAAQSVDDWRRYYERVKADGGYAFCKTGLYALDRQLGGGMFRQGMYIIGARPGMGKTTLALNIAENIAGSGKPVLFVSLEMSRIQIISKRIAAASLLSYTDIITGKLDDAGIKLTNEIVERINSKPFYMTDRSGMTSAEIMRAARQIEGISAIVVDYLGLVRPSDDAAKKPRYEQMTEISADLKAIAKTLDVPVLVLCQLNRENASRADARPRLTDLRDSGAIEQDADAVILLHRKDYYKATEAGYSAPDIEEIELIVAKNRHANTGVVSLGWSGKTGYIGEFDTIHDDEPRKRTFEPIGDDDELPF